MLLKLRVSVGVGKKNGILWKWGFNFNELLQGVNPYFMEVFQGWRKVKSSTGVWGGGGGWYIKCNSAGLVECWNCLFLFYVECLSQDVLLSLWLANLDGSSVILFKMFILISILLLLYILPVRLNLVWDHASPFYLYSLRLGRKVIYLFVRTQVKMQVSGSIFFCGLRSKTYEKLGHIRLKIRFDVLPMGFGFLQWCLNYM